MAQTEAVSACIFCYSLESLLRVPTQSGKHMNWVIDSGGRESCVGLGIFGEKQEIVCELSTCLTKPVKYWLQAAMLFAIAPKQSYAQSC